MATEAQPQCSSSECTCTRVGPIHPAAATAAVQKGGLDRTWMQWLASSAYPTQIFIRSPPSRQHKAPPQNSENKRQWTTRQHKCVGEELLQVQTVHTHTHKRPAKRAPPLLSVGGWRENEATEQEQHFVFRRLTLEISLLNLESVKVFSNKVIACKGGGATTQCRPIRTRPNQTGVASDLQHSYCIVDVEVETAVQMVLRREHCRKSQDWLEAGWGEPEK